MGQALLCKYLSVCIALQSVEARDGCFTLCAMEICQKTKMKWIISVDLSGVSYALFVCLFICFFGQITIMLVPAAT